MGKSKGVDSKKVYTAHLTKFSIYPSHLLGALGRGPHAHVKLKNDPVVFLFF